MAAKIAVVAEQELEGDVEGGPAAAAQAAVAASTMFPTAPAPLPVPPVSRETEIVGAIQILNGRLQAVEAAVQGVPKAAGIVRGLLAALGTQTLICLAMMGCMGLAIPLALNPTWQGAAILGAFSVIIYLPLAALALWGKAR